MPTFYVAIRRGGKGKIIISLLHEQELCDRGWCPFMYIYVCVFTYDSKLEWHFSGRLTFSNTRGKLLVEVID